ncbi:hypothetical protein EAF00_011094 [Botryotinia globosa]|nr:hypothetical protein EAF00_011094 [Botryotinia globosa]
MSTPFGWSVLDHPNMVIFTRPDFTKHTTNNGPVPCRACSTSITCRGFVCECTDQEYYCSEFCRGQHFSFCISNVSKHVVRPTPQHKLALYFPPNTENPQVFWCPCPAINLIPCFPFCNPCIVCESCHDCNGYDIPLPAPILALGANTTANLQDDLVSWMIKPEKEGLADWTPGTVIGLEDGDVLDQCGENMCIQKLTGWTRGWIGPFVLVGDSCADCNGKTTNRDINMDDMETAKKFFLSTSPKDLVAAEAAIAERKERGIFEMNDILGRLLNGK